MNVDTKEQKDSNNILDETSDIEQSSFFDVFKKFKLYAENHTSLVIGVSSIVISAITLFLRLCMYAYKSGYYSYFGVDVSNVSFMSNDSLLQILFLLVLTIVILFFNAVGYAFYTQRSFLKYYFSFSLICYFFTILYFFPVYHMTAEEYIQMLISVFGLVAILHAFLLPIFILRPKDVILLRNQMKLNGFENKNKKIEEKIKNIKDKKNLPKLKNKSKKLNAKIDKVEKKIIKLKSNSNNENYQNNDRFSNKAIFNILITFVITFSAVVLVLYFGGHHEGQRTTQMEVLDNMPNVSLSDDFTGKVSDYAVIFKNEDYCIASPCYEEKISNTKTDLTIYNDYQIKLDANNQIFHKKNYNNIEMK